MWKNELIFIYNIFDIGRGGLFEYCLEFVYVYFFVGLSIVFFFMNERFYY